LANASRDCARWRRREQQTIRLAEAPQRKPTDLCAGKPAIALADGRETMQLCGKQSSLPPKIRRQTFTGDRMRLVTFRRAVVVTLTAASVLGTSGCFGSFNLTRKLYGFNKDVSKDKFVRELVFLGLNIVPIYAVAGFIDAVVANTVEFWTGENPISMTGSIKVDSTTVVKRVGIVKKDGERVMTLSTYKSDKLVATTTMSLKPGATAMTFETALADGRTSSYVVALNAQGNAVLASTIQRASHRAEVAVQH
jgi:hypothetical protein